MYCPDCGARMEGRYCPNCGSEKMIEEDTRGKGKPEAAQTVDPFLETSLPRSKALDDGIGASPVVQFLKKLVASPLILLCALLLTVYAAGICYCCGASILDTNLRIVNNQFDSYLSLDKLSRIVYMFVCVAHLCMALGLALSTWSLFWTGVKRNQPTMSLGGFSTMQVLSRICTRLFLLLTISALVALGYCIIDPGANVAILNSLLVLPSGGAMQIGISDVVVVLTQSKVFRAAILIVIFLLNTVRFAALKEVFSAVCGMLRSGEMTRRGTPPAALLNFLCGLITCAASGYALILTKMEQEALLFYGPLFASGLACVLSSFALYRCTSGIGQMQS